MTDRPGPRWQNHLKIRWGRWGGEDERLPYGLVVWVVSGACWPEFFEWCIIFFCVGGREGVDQCTQRIISSKSSLEGSSNCFFLGGNQTWCNKLWVNFKGKQLSQTKLHEVWVAVKKKHDYTCFQESGRKFLDTKDGGKRLVAKNNIFWVGGRHGTIGDLLFQVDFPSKRNPKSYSIPLFWNESLERNDLIILVPIHCLTFIALDFFTYQLDCVQHAYYCLSLFQR